MLIWNNFRQQYMALIYSKSSSNVNCWLCASSNYASTIGSQVLDPNNKSHRVLAFSFFTSWCLSLSERRSFSCLWSGLPDVLLFSVKIALTEVVWALSEETVRGQGEIVQIKHHVVEEHKENERKGRGEYGEGSIIMFHFLGHHSPSSN